MSPALALRGAECRARSGLSGRSGDLCGRNRPHRLLARSDGHRHPLPCAAFHSGPSTRLMMEKIPPLKDLDSKNRTVGKGSVYAPNLPCHSKSEEQMSTATRGKWRGVTDAALGAI